MKTVVITGSTRGIGLGLAGQFLEQGCRVVVSSRHQDDVDNTIVALADAYGAEQVSGWRCDITKTEDLQGLWDFAQERFGTVDIWINNAGMSVSRKAFWLLDNSSIERIVTTNLTGMLLANKIVLKGMVKQNHGQIWNMEGFGSDGMTQIGMTAYGSTKCAVNYLNKSLKKEVAATQVQVCTLSPGIVVTDLLTGDYDLQSEEWQKTKKIFNILADTVDTVAPYLVKGILNSNHNGAKVAWLTNRKAAFRFMTAMFNKRDLFTEIEAQAS